MTDWKERAAALADIVVTEAAINDETWRDAFATTPRHLFVPQFWAVNEFNSPTSTVRGDAPAQREAWLDAIYRDEALITQWAPRTTEDGREYRVITSSASLPSIVATMLDRLDVCDGHRVLEVGTGSGFNAALLCSRLGEDRVHSIDIDPALVAPAIDRLASAGHHPTISVTNGATLPATAGYDRIIATCAISQVPESWVRQLASGGRLVAPMSFGGALAVLDKTADDTLTGFVDHAPVYFMPLRDAAEQALPAHVGYPMPSHPAEHQCHRGMTDVDPGILDDLDFQLWLAVHLPHAEITHAYSDDGRRTLAIIYTAQDRATVRHHPAHDGRWPVVQYGRRPWDTVEVAARAWRQCGQPGRDRLGITVRVGNDAAQYAWLDAPDAELTWPLPG